MSYFLQAINNRSAMPSRSAISSSTSRIVAVVLTMLDNLAASKAGRNYNEPKY